MAKSKNPDAVALGALGGKKGGRARAAALSPERRSEIAKKAAETRWKSIKEEAYADFHAFLDDLHGKAPSGHISPLPNRAVKVFYENNLFWVRPLELTGRTLICRLQTNPWFAKFKTSLTWGQILHVDVTQIMVIEGKRLDETDQIVGDILAKAT